MIMLGFAAIAWVAVHVGVSGTALRGRIVAAIGERGFMLAFSLASVATIAALVAAYKAAPYDPIWTAPAALGWLLVAAMLVACVFLVGSVTSPNPTMAGATAAVPQGMSRVTRHPMLWAFSIWAVVHILGNGDLASLLFFGAFLATSLAGMPSIDAKIARRDPARWAALAAATTILPDLSRLGGIGWKAPVGGLVLWALLLGAHPHVIGVSPYPVALAASPAPG